jgi:AcrR family transcriptional regulator
MPKETFLNLSEDKREKIINVALEEFSLYDYNTASLSRIVENAGIAKGSMYQYFENKKDLYLYLIGYVADAKLSFITQTITHEENDFYKMFKELNLTSAMFDLSHPVYSRMLVNAMREVNNKELGDMASNILKMSDEYLKGFVLMAQQSGQIRRDIDTEFIAFLISRLSVSLQDYISIKYNFSYHDIVTRGSGELPVSREDIEKVLDDLILIFKTGIEA